MSISEFHKTTAKELEAVKDRIRLLLNHWGEDGKYKEKIFINILKNFLPQKYGVATGFVVKRKPFTFKEHQENKPIEHISSAQIDVIIFNSDSPLLFREGDFAIVTPEAVEAIIEIKTNLENANAKSVIEKMNDQGDFVLTGKSNKQKVLFNGIFSYEGFDDIDGVKIENYYKQGSEIALKDNKHSHFQYSR